METLLKAFAGSYAHSADWTHVFRGFTVFLLPDVEIDGNTFMVDDAGYRLPADGPMTLGDRHSVWVAVSEANPSDEVVFVTFDNGAAVEEIVAADRPELLAPLFAAEAALVL